jgi:hypothetical protein
VEACTFLATTLASPAGQFLEPDVRVEVDRLLTTFLVTAEELMIGAELQVALYEALFACCLLPHRLTARAPLLPYAIPLFSRGCLSTHLIVRSTCHRLLRASRPLLQPRSAPLVSRETFQLFQKQLTEDDLQAGMQVAFYDYNSQLATEERLAQQQDHLGGSGSNSRSSSSSSQDANSTLLLQQEAVADSQSLTAVQQIIESSTTTAAPPVEEDAEEEQAVEVGFAPTEVAVSAAVSDPAAVASAPVSKKRKTAHVDNNNNNNNSSTTEMDVSLDGESGMNTMDGPDEDDEGALWSF